jgi:hypothetical protein
VPGADPYAVLSAVETANPDADRLEKSFQTPTGVRVDYDVRSPRDRWVITGVGNRPVDRVFDGWPRLEEGRDG